MADDRYTEHPEHKHQDDQVFGKTSAEREEKADRLLDETDGDPDELEDDASGRPEPHAGGRAEG